MKFITSDAKIRLAQSTMYGACGGLSTFAGIYVHRNFGYNIFFVTIVIFVILLIATSPIRNWALRRLSNG